MSPCLRGPYVTGSIIPRNGSSLVFSSSAAWPRLDSRSKAARRRRRPRSRRLRRSGAGALSPSSTHRGTASSAPPSACARIVHPGSCCAPSKLDGKTLIHNFGHGGSGMSLSWGTASMATDLALAHAERNAAVLGSGVVGLTSARELQRHGFDVTIYAATVPPDTTSNMSLAGFTPTSGLVDTAKRTPRVGRAVPRRRSLIAYRRLQLLAGSEVRRHLDHELRADRQRAAGRGGGGGASRRTRCCRRASPTRASSCSRASIRSRRSMRSSAARCASSRRSISTR